jgi:arylsulfatase A-like enzyme
VERKALAQLPAAARGAQNVLVLVVDTLRADHLSTYGYRRATSPNLDRLAAEGVLFEEAYSTSSWTPPSHASMLTGRYVHELGDENRVDARFPTLAEELRDRGYRTAAISGNAYYFCRRAGFGRGFIRFEDYFYSVASMAVRTLYGRKIEEYILRRLGFAEVPKRRNAEEVNHAVLNWIDRDGLKPFFVFVNYFDVHEPYLPPQPWRSRFSQGKHPGGILNGLHGRRTPVMTPQQLQSEIDAYDGGISYVDEQINRLLVELEQRGLRDKTILVLTSDHGEGLGDHGLYLHRNSLYREAIRVPFVIRAPGRVPAGLRIPRPVSNSAIPATVMDLLGVTESEFPGRSLTALWWDPHAAANWPEPLSEMGEFPFDSKRSPAYHGWLKSLVTPEWHYILQQRGVVSLFNWPNDPGELNDLSPNPEFTDVLKHLDSRMQSVFSRANRATHREDRQSIRAPFKTRQAEGEPTALAGPPKSKGQTSWRR